MHATDAVTNRICIDLLRTDAHPVPVRAHLSWLVADPYRVRMTFETGKPDRPQVLWVLSRELLAEGLTRAVGLGDVRITPDAGDQDSLLLRLSAPLKQVTFRMAAWELAKFLDATFDMVPLGAELLWVPLDAEIAALLDTAAS